MATLQKKKHLSKIYLNVFLSKSVRNVVSNFLIYIYFRKELPPAEDGIEHIKQEMCSINPQKKFVRSFDFQIFLNRAATFTKKKNTGR